jgi:hypothetical protein
VKDFGPALSGRAPEGQPLLEDRVRDHLFCHDVSQVA